MKRALQKSALPRITRSTWRGTASPPERGLGGARHTIAIAVLFCSGLVLAPCYAIEPALDTSRLVTVGGTVSEVVFALGRGDAVVGTDTSSVYPAAAAQRPRIGYQRTLAVEGILSLQPTLVLATDEAGPPAVFEQLRSAGVAVRQIQHPQSVDQAKAVIREIAMVLGETAAAERLVADLDRDLARAATQVRDQPSTPRVLFVYARGAGTLLVSGRETPADEIIRLAGGVNAVREYTGFKPLTSEAAVSAAPNVLLIPTRGLESLGGTAGLLELPGIAQTPAAARQRIVAMDDLYLLGFGPRVGQAVQELATQLHSDGAGSARGGGESTP